MKELGGSKFGSVMFLIGAMAGSIMGVVALSSCAMPELNRKFETPLAECRRACMRGVLEYYTDAEVDCRCKFKAKKQQIASLPIED